MNLLMYLNTNCRYHSHYHLLPSHHRYCSLLYNGRCNHVYSITITLKSKRTAPSTTPSHPLHPAHPSQIESLQVVNAMVNTHRREDMQAILERSKTLNLLYDEAKCVGIQDAETIRADFESKLEASEQRSRNLEVKVAAAEKSTATVSVVTPVLSRNVSLLFDFKIRVLKRMLLKICEYNYILYKVRVLFI